MTPSRYQTAIYDWVRGGSGNAIVTAVAGGAKTTSLVAAMEHMNGKIRFAAFNKHIAEELKSRVPAHAKVSTIHSMGFAAIRRRLKGVVLDDQKMRGIAKEVMGDDYDTRLARIAAEQLASMAKLTLTDPTPENLSDLILTYDIDVNGDEDAIVEAVPEMLELDKEDESSIDFDDMVWLPNVLNLNPEKADWLCLDESQDLSASQRELVLKCLKAGSRALAVGDRSQAIFNFAGADSSSIQKIKERLNAKSLPLSICYRCPRSHVELAQQIVPLIEAAPWAKEGVIRNANLADCLDDLRDGDMVICRINAPLAEVAMSLVRRGKKAVLRGRDIGTNLWNLVQRVNRHKSDDVAEVIGLLKDYVEREAPKLVRARKERKLNSLRDRVETIITLSDGVDTVGGLQERIAEIFSNDKKGIVCSSIHRAKGLEADRVALYRPELVPFPKAGPGEMDQEWNLKYVAFTRAKEELWFVKE